MKFDQIKCPICGEHNPIKVLGLKFPIDCKKCNAHLLVKKSYWLEAATFIPVYLAYLTILSATSKAFGHNLDPHGWEELIMLSLIAYIFDGFFSSKTAEVLVNPNGEDN
ncbi:MAG: hypothetical protein HZT40_14755 [Candidatus Thiothrix singaporensis]|uniref:Uncharacterized protein n=1 Tax=Candidatus Thiothrix singaporensis TaxID=2799669 RepID=A0A7L6AU36_9GAMM|nr:MAG: hypothetical protein HZT40_14755 [Candidatus Thiothrix singaporensis]